MKHLIAIAVAAIFITKSFAAGDGWCGSNRLLQQKLADDPALKAQMEDAIANYKANEARMGKGNRATGVVYVPVVFHIIHNGDALGTGENIPDEQIISQIDALNLNFSHSNPDTANIPAEFKGLVKDTKIQFCLARYNPQGNPTTGIERLQFNQATWDSENDIETNLKPATIWDRSKYLNIWSVRMGGTLSSGGTLAYATLPFFTDNKTDGVLARYNTIGTTGALLSNYTLGRTVVHEVGHWLGLFHIWGNDDGQTNMCDNGANQYPTSDFIDDTPDQADKYFGCPTYPQYSCNTSNMFMNHMDYTNDDCRHLFSAGQGDRMYGVLTQGGQGNRLSISNASSKCFLSFDGSMPRLIFPLDSICSTVFSPIAVVKNVGFTDITSGTIYYSIDGGATSSVSWTGNLSTNQEERVTLPQITTTAGNHTISVSFENPNGVAIDNDASNDGNTFNLFVYEGGGPGLATPFTEDFESGIFPPVNYSIVNGGNANTWKQAEVSAYTDFGGYSAVIDNLNYTLNPNKAKDAFVTDDFDVNQLVAPKLSFDVAYARYNANRSDTLIVYYSLDCGSHYYQIYKNGGVSLSTSADKTSAFVPTETEWKNISLALTGLKGQTKVRFKFENIAGWGNALYLDNINVFQDVNSIIEDARPKLPVSVYPNPASSLLSVKLPIEHPFTSYEIVNAIGQKISGELITQHALILNTEALKNGLYFIRLIAPGFTQHKTFVIAK
jgi:hypothetical protein